MMLIIIGCRAHGCWLPKSASSGLRRGGVGAAVYIFSMQAGGALTSDSMGEFLTDSDTSVMGMKADVGTADTFSTIAPSTT